MTSVNTVVNSGDGKRFFFQNPKFAFSTAQDLSPDTFIRRELELSRLAVTVPNLRPASAKLRSGVETGRHGGLIRLKRLASQPVEWMW